MTTLAPTLPVVLPAAMPHFAAGDDVAGAIAEAVEPIRHLAAWELLA
ncbi:hypothetical protein OKA06_10655 [Novosphingobium sp. MW5]|nr:hypothetical protein [Novosphingobium sp. MW5]